MIVRPSLFYDFKEVPFDLRSFKFDLHLLQHRSESRTFIVDGIVAMILGVTVVWEGCGEVWSLPTPLIQGRGLSIVRGTKQLISDAIDKFSLRQIRTGIDASELDDIRWIELIGFKHEATLTRATVNLDDILIYKYERSN